MQANSLTARGLLLPITCMVSGGVILIISIMLIIMSK